MIYINEEKYEPKHFSDGTLDMRIPIDLLVNKPVHIAWYFENNEELVTLIFITRHLQTNGIHNIDLTLPYVPNGRQDRAPSSADVFTLKYFAEIINSLNFKTVFIFDPHSDVSAAVLNHSKVITARDNIYYTIRDIGEEDLLMFYPDEGAMKRYSEMVPEEYIHGVKKRDWLSHQIQTLNIKTDDIDIVGRNILMVDDILSSGKTLLRAAEQLKKMGVNKIYLYASHCENQVEKSPLLTSDIVTEIYTTNSLLTYRHPKIHVINI
ncbi:MAG: ribose-phosphate pyrophosphokinase [Agathobacter sp.]|nr:ribose-phosphate pyrophosphokinase [Agathobacter sp.]